jgi:hypothetical protein
MPTVSFKSGDDTISFGLINEMSAIGNGMAAGFAVSRDLTYGRTEYVNPVEVTLPIGPTNKGIQSGARLTAARLPNGPGITYFKDAGSSDAYTKGMLAIGAVKEAILKDRDKDGRYHYKKTDNTLTEADDLELTNQAIAIINNQYESSIQREKDKDGNYTGRIGNDDAVASTIKLPSGSVVKISEPVYIINKKFKNLQDFHNNIKVGISGTRIPGTNTRFPNTISEADAHELTLRAMGSDLGVRFGIPKYSAEVPLTEADQGYKQVSQDENDY